MKKLCLSILAVIFVCSPLFAQDTDQLLKDSKVKLAELKTEYDKLSNEYSAKIDIPFSITRVAPNGAEIKLNLTKWSCKGECSDANKVIFQGIIDKAGNVVEYLVNSVKAKRQKGIKYTNTNGDISIKLFEIEAEDDKVNDLLDEIFDYLNVNDTLSFNLDVVAKKESNDVMIIDDGSLISGIKIPASVISDNTDTGAGNSKFLKAVIKMGKIKMNGKLEFGKTFTLKGYFKGIIKIISNALADSSQIFDVLFDFKNKENNYFKTPVLDPESVQGDE
jgi:hypothetical protein